MKRPVPIRLLLIFFFALAVRWAVCSILVPGGLSSGPMPGLDDMEYHLLADNLANGRGFAYGPAYPPTAFRTPVYPLFLAVIYKIAGHRFALVRWIQFVISALGCCFIWLLGRELVIRSQVAGLSRHADKTADLAALFACVDPSMFYHAGYFETEALFVPGMAVAGWCLIVMLDPARRRWALPVSGLVLGLMTLLRPNALLLVVLVMPWLAVSLASWRKAIAVHSLLLAVTMAVMAPWVIRNAIRFHRFVPLATNSGMNLWGSNNPLMVTDNPARYGAWPGGIITDIGLIPGTEDFQMSWLNPKYKQFEVDDRCKQLAIRFIFTHPAGMIRLIAAKFIRFWTFAIRNSMLERLAFGVAEGGMLVLALIGLVLSWRWSHPPHLLLILFLSVQLNALIFFANTRMRVGMAPAIVVYAAIGALLLWSHWRRHHATV